MEITSASFVIGAASPAQLPDSRLPEVAFVGRSNVGKSSLINSVLRRKNLARTSGAPGKTREFNFYLVNEAFHLVDLPGLGYAKVSRTERARWARSIESYLGRRGSLRLLFHLVDSRHPLMGSDDSLIELHRRMDVPVVIVLTKADKLSGNDRARVVGRVQAELQSRGLELPIVLSSANSGRGRREILDWIELVTRQD
jgi:GTP-binding protein